MSKISISVCICTHNPNPEIFPQVIAGLQVQTLLLDNWEIIVIDNASDQSVEAVYAESFSWNPTVRFVFERERGYAWARRSAIENAKGDLILFVDDDCVLEATYLEESLKLMTEHSDVGVLTGAVKFQCPSEFKGFSKHLHDIIYFGGNFSGYIETKIKTRFTVAMRGAAGMTIRRDVGNAFLQRFWIYPEIISALQKVNLPSNLHYEDLDLAMYALHHNYKIARSGELQLTHETLEKEMNYLLFLNRAYQTGFFLELFFMRWNWFSYSRFSIREWGRLLRMFAYPIFPIVPWLVHLIQFGGSLQARWFIINRQNLINKVCRR
jgi:glycosyltransferase involved in cell wall biosynthesis